MMEKAGGTGTAHNATVTVQNNTGKDGGALRAAETKVTKLRAHLAGAEAELARLRAEGND